MTSSERLKIAELRLGLLEDAVADGGFTVDVLAAEHLAIGALLESPTAAHNRVVAELMALDEVIAKGIADGSVIMPLDEVPGAWERKHQLREAAGDGPFAALARAELGID